MSISAERPFSVGQVVWTPTEDAREHSLLARYMASVGRSGEDYDELWQWSVSDLEGFWSSIWDFFEIRATTPYERVLGSRAMPGAEWFPGARLNFAAHMLGRDDELDAVAVLARSQSRDPFDLTFGDLRDRVARARAGLQRLGVGPGDRVVAYLPNIPETLVAFLAAASLGAIWATCPPEFGPRSVLDRLGQLEPSVLLAVDGYRWGETWIDRREQVAEVRSGLPSLRSVVHVPYGGNELPDTVPWDELVAEAGPLEFDPVPFDHPLYVLFSSGTTGLPKAIVHGHGGILLEHLKNHGLSWDLRPGDRLMWFTTTAWMMWNALVSALLLRASIVMLDGNPGYPDLSQQWRLVEETKATMFGLSPAFTMACRKEGLEPGRDFDLSTLKMICAAGSPLPADSYEWIYEQAGPEMMLNVGSGGTDVCTGLVQGYPLLPVYAGEMAGKCLGVDVAAFDSDGNEVVGELGELVIRQPMPSMPVEVLERRGRLAVPGRLLRRLPRRLAARRLDHVHRAGHLDHHGPLRRDPEPRRRPPGHERAVRRRRGVRRGARRAGRPPRSDRRAPALRRPPRRSRARRRPEEEHLRRAPRPDCPRATSPTTSSRCRRSRAR